MYTVSQTHRFDTLSDLETPHTCLTTPHAVASCLSSFLALDAHPAQLVKVGNQRAGHLEKVSISKEHNLRAS